jgi:hypothetical protein
MIDPPSKQTHRRRLAASMMAAPAAPMMVLGACFRME